MSTRHAGKTRKTLAANLKRIFKARKLNSNQLSKKIKGEVSQRAIHALLLEDYDPGVSVVERVARGLGMQTWELLMDRKGHGRLVLLYKHMTAEERARVDRLLTDVERRQKKCDDGCADDDVAPQS